MDYVKEDLLEQLVDKFKDCDYSDSNGFTFSVEARGARGGSCWGSEATPFRKSTSELVDDMQEYIPSNVESFLHLFGLTIEDDVLRSKSYSLAENIVDSYYDTTDNREYYGNYSEYNKYFVSINDILEMVEDNISPKEKEDILEVASVAQDIVDSERMKENKYKYLQEVTNKISTFEKDSANEQSQLKKQLERAQKEVETIQSKLTNLEKTQSKNLTSLEKQKKELTDFLGQDYIASKSKKKKHGY